VARSEEAMTSKPRKRKARTSMVFMIFRFPPSRALNSVGYKDSARTLLDDAGVNEMRVRLVEVR